MEEYIRPDFKKYIPSLIKKIWLMFAEEGLLLMSVYSSFEILSGGSSVKEDSKKFSER
jgi:hypothetical protein